MQDDQRARFRTQYELDGTFDAAFARWTETSNAQAQAGEPRLGPRAETLAVELRASLALAVDEENDAMADWEAIHSNLAGWSPFAVAINTTYALVLVVLCNRQQHFEREASAAWSKCRRIEDCLEVLHTSYVHFDAELNEEHQAIHAARVAIDSGLERLARLDEELARSGRSAWYRMLVDGPAAHPPGFDEPLALDERATFSHARNGRDPVVALLIARDLLRLVPTIGSLDEPRRGRPEKGNLNRLVDVFTAIDLPPSRIRDVLVDLGFDGKTEAHPDNIRRIRNRNVGAAR